MKQIDFFTEKIVPYLKTKYNDLEDSDFKFGAKEIKVILEQTGFKISKCVSNFCLVPPYLLPFKRFKRLDQIVPVFTCFINLLIPSNSEFSKS